jgi:hypothetical protein
VALHRAAHVARANPAARVLLTTFSDALASALRANLARLTGNEPRVRERIEVDALDAVARRLHERVLGRVDVAPPGVVCEVVAEAARGVPPHSFTDSFLRSEWTDVVDAWQLDSWEAYRDVARLGRKTRLPEKQRRTLWAIFERVRRALEDRNLVTPAGVYTRLAAHLRQPSGRPTTSSWWTRRRT